MSFTDSIETNLNEAIEKRDRERLANLCLFTGRMSCKSLWRSAKYAYIFDNNKKGVSLSDWTAGYVADVGYTYGYQTELNPLRIKLAFLHNGFVFPEVETACELGFGQGLSINIHAAASTTRWYGTDFNPSHTAFAQELARKAGTDVCLSDESFAEFAARTDLPDFDFIGMHGIWSWISDENRSIILDFIRRKLKVGGVLFISYNAYPGWAAFAPVRHLMNRHAEILETRNKNLISRVDSALDFSEQLLATNPAFLLANPQISDALTKIKEDNRYYLAHEYFNEHWQPMHFSSIAELLDSAKVQFACSASYLEHIDAINLKADQLSFLQNIKDPVFREDVRDFMVNQRFRKDYWVKGATKLNQFDRAELLRQQNVILANNREDVSLKTTGALGEATMNKDVYAPILDVLADNEPKTISEIEQAVKPQKISFAQVIQALIVFGGQGHIAAYQDENVITSVSEQCDKLNAHLIAKARKSNEIACLSSPVTGGGVPVGRFQQLFLLAMHQGIHEPSEWGRYVWKILQAQGQTIVKEKKPLETAEANQAELTEIAQKFLEKQLPLFKTLRIN